MKHYLGIDIGGTKIAYGLFDANKQLQAKLEVPTNTTLSAPHFFDLVLEQARSFTKTNEISFSSIQGIGIGVPSFLNFDTGHIVKTGSIPLLRDFPVKAYLEEKLGQQISVVIDNDANTAALAELRQGAGKRFKHFIFTLISTGIGSGLIINRQLFRGSTGLAGESGHMLAIPYQSEKSLGKGICGCNNDGCFNSLCSGMMITHHVRQWVAEGNKTILPDLAGGINKITAKHIAEAYHHGDKVATRALKQMIHYSAVWLYNMYVFLNIDCFIFSGGLLNMGEFYLQEIEKQFYSYADPATKVQFLKTDLKSDAGLIGAFELLFKN